MRLQLVRDRFITGQENRALRRHLDSAEPDTPIAEIVDRCRVWESHEETNPGWLITPELNRPCANSQVTDSNNNETTQVAKSFPSDYGVLAQRLCAMVQPPTPGNSDSIDIEQLLRKLIPAGSAEDKSTRPAPETREAKSVCFSCGSNDHTTSRCERLDESFPFLPAGWQVDRKDNECMLRPPPPPRRDIENPVSGNVA